MLTSRQDLAPALSTGSVITLASSTVLTPACCPTAPSRVLSNLTNLSSRQSQPPNDPAPALTGFGGRLVGIIAVVAVPGSAGFQPAKRNPAGKMPALPGGIAIHKCPLKVRNVTS